MKMYLTFFSNIYDACLESASDYILFKEVVLESKVIGGRMGVGQVHFMTL